MAKKQWIDYEERLNRVTSWIFDHLDEDIDLNQMADLACLSPYHWHRVYQAMRGETIAATVRRLRMDKATAYLLHSGMTIANRQEMRLWQCTGLYPAVYLDLWHATGTLSPRRQPYPF